VVELTSPSNLRQFLIILREKELIDENQYIQTLDGLKGPFKINGNQFTPFLDIYGIKQLDTELQRLNQSMTNIDIKIKEVIHAWETKTLAKNETKKLLTELVAEQNKLIKNQEELQARIHKKILRMKSLEKTFNFDLERYVSTFLKTTAIKEMGLLLNEFKAIWSRYSTGIIPTDELKQRPQLDDVELDILRALMVPIPESEKEIFNLDEVIQPIDQDESFEITLLSRAQKEESIVEIQDEVLETKEIISPWDLVGLIAYDPSKTPLGLFRPPIVVNELAYLPIVKEKPLTMSIIKREYRDLFNQVGFDLNVTTTQQIRNQIITALKIPEEFALYPSFFNQWVSELGLEVVPAKPQLAKAWFIEPDLVNKDSLELLTVKSEDLKKLSIPAWIPAKGGKTAQQDHIGQRIIGMAGSEFGFIAGIMHETPFGQCVIIERKIPPSYLLDLYLKGLGKKSLAELRLFIAKELDKEEGEAFSAENLWLICNQERLLISPHEITASYFSVLPATAFSFSDKILAKIGVYYHSVPETFRYLVGKALYKTEEETGLIYGFSVHQGELSILWSSENPIDIIKRLGKKTSDQYVNRLQRRISLALDISYEKSIWPSNLARYFMNFIWMEEQLTLQMALTVIKERFSLQEVLFSKITAISKDGLKCGK
jgi:hypothetical protein